MKLFTNNNPNYMEFGKFAEPHYSFLNRSARPESITIKEILESWFSHYPQEEKGEFLRRFQSKDDISFSSSFFELYIHELLYQLEYSIKVHPISPDEKKRPDFLAYSSGSDEFYIEAVLATDLSVRDAGKNAIMNTVYDIIDEIDSPNFLIGMNISGAPNTPPPAARIKSDLKNWLEGLDPSQIEPTDLDTAPKLEFSHEGWIIEFFPIPKSPETRDENNIRPIAVQSYGAKGENPYVAIRDAIVKKAKHYGKLDKPYVIAINGLNSSVERIDIMEALFGKEIFPPRNIYQMTRAGDGALIDKSGHSRYTRVSAILVVNHVSPWNIADTNLCLYHNPWAALPCQGKITQLSEAIPRNGNEPANPEKIITRNKRMEWKEGIHPRTFFNVSL